METAGGRSAGVVGCFERGVADIGDLSALGAAPDGGAGFQELSLLCAQLDASARTPEASLVRQLSPFASGRARRQAARA